MFTLHPQLVKDTVPVEDLSICRVLLMNNRHFPWLVLVPMRDGLRELFDLQPDDYRAVMEEVRTTSELLAVLTQAYKMNVAALGNAVPQLHIHIIARFPRDIGWPNPVWGSAAEPYAEQELAAMVERLKAFAFGRRQGS